MSVIEKKDAYTTDSVNRVREIVSTILQNRVDSRILQPKAIGTRSASQEGQDTIDQKYLPWSAQRVVREVLALAHEQNLDLTEVVVELARRGYTKTIHFERGTEVNETTVRAYLKRHVYQGAARKDYGKLVRAWADELGPLDPLELVRAQSILRGQLRIRGHWYEDRRALLMLRVLIEGYADTTVSFTELAEKLNQAGYTYAQREGDQDSEIRSYSLASFFARALEGEASTVPAMVAYLDTILTGMHISERDISEVETDLSSFKKKPPGFHSAPEWAKDDTVLALVLAGRSLGVTFLALEEQILELTGIHAEKDSIRNFFRTYGAYQAEDLGISPDALAKAVDVATRFRKSMRSVETVTQLDIPQVRKGLWSTDTRALLLMRRILASATDKRFSKHRYSELARCLMASGYGSKGHEKPFVNQTTISLFFREGIRKKDFTEAEMVAFIDAKLENREITPEHISEVESDFSITRNQPLGVVRLPAWSKESGVLAFALACKASGIPYVHVARKLGIQDQALSSFFIKNGHLHYADFGITSAQAAEMELEAAAFKDELQANGELVKRQAFARQKVRKPRHAPAPRPSQKARPRELPQKVMQPEVAVGNGGAWTEEQSSAWFAMHIYQSRGVPLDQLGIMSNLLKRMNYRGESGDVVTPNEFIRTMRSRFTTPGAKDMNYPLMQAKLEERARAFRERAPDEAAKIESAVEGHFVQLETALAEKGTNITFKRKE